MFQLSEIFIYPIKSLSGIPMPEARVQLRGLQYDRRWMLTDADGIFVTQREFPEMALLGTAIEPPFLKVFQKNKPQQHILIPLEPDAAGMTKKQVQVWSQRCASRQYESDINGWFSDVLGANLFLQYMPDTTRRATDGRYAPKGQYVSFADGFPYLLIGQASLDALNARLEVPVPMDRFRPNFVFTGGTAFAEDEWAQFSVGELQFACSKPCARCPIPTINQQTATRSAEPLRTLSQFRRSGHKVLFGQNVVCLNVFSAENTIIRRGETLIPVPKTQ